MSALLDIRGLRAWYGMQPVLDGVDLALAPGETLALLGRNGSGRSTLAKAVMGLVQTAGSVHIAGVECAGARTFEIARRGVAYVAESRDVFPLLSVRDNLRLGLRGASGAAGEGSRKAGCVGSGPSSPSASRSDQRFRKSQRLIRDPPSCTWRRTEPLPSRCQSRRS